ncbi:hypothetical protein quinque_002804 [Culex quinquefasciatus]
MSKITRKVVYTSRNPKPVSHFSQAIIADRTIYCSGVIGIEMDEPKVVPGGVAAQAATALKYLSDLLEDAGSGIDNVVKITILLTDMQDYDAVNVEYKKVFSSNHPARTCVAVSKLPLGAAVEIEAIAIVGDVQHVAA